jgi:hypothetical protein
MRLAEHKGNWASPFFPGRGLGSPHAPAHREGATALLRGRAGAGTASVSCASCRSGYIRQLPLWFSALVYTCTSVQRELTPGGPGSGLRPGRKRFLCQLPL